MPPAAETKRPAAPPEAMGWTACAEELSELRRECAQLGEIFDNLWEEMSKLRSDLTLRSEQYEQLRQTVSQQQKQLAARSDALQQGLTRMEERQQQFAEIFTELISLRDDRRRKL